MADSPKANNGPALRQEPRPQSRSPTQMAGAQLLTHHCCLRGAALAGRWNPELQPGTEPRYFDMAYVCPNH